MADVSADTNSRSSSWTYASAVFCARRSTSALAPKVFDTLRLLVENAGHLMTKEELLRQLWPDTVVEENNLNKNISVLRKVLGEIARRAHPALRPCPVSAIASWQRCAL